jgi:hypothetical protein
MEKIIETKSIDFLLEYLLFLAFATLEVEEYDKSAYFLLQANQLIDMSTTTSGKYKS